MPIAINPSRTQVKHLLVTLFISIPAFLGSAWTAPTQAREVELRVGIVQRFGEEATDKLTVTSTQGDTLTLRWRDRTGQVQTLSVPKITLEILKQPLSPPVLQERVVLSDQATFETAEDSANQWKAKGIKVEVTQPERWQVWAKRDVYSTPLVRRLLLQSLHTKGYTQSYLESSILASKPQATFTVLNNRYSSDYLIIAAQTQRVQVQKDNGKTHLYGGSLQLQPNAYGTYTLVNSVPVETYLRGVVPHEIGPGAPDNATRAQTIIARTYALRNLRRFQADGYELCATVHCQVYYGLTGTTPRVDQAIASTKGLVLTYQNELVDALYSSTTGGITATFGDVWNGEERPYLRAVIDSSQKIWDLSSQSLSDETAFRRFISLKEGFNETGRNVFRWRKEASIEQINKDLKEYFTKRKHPLANFQTIQWMEVTQRSPSGRILTLKIQTDKGILELYKNEVRSALGAPRSTLFYLEPIYTAQKQLKGFAFVGGGFGHGVGMSQYGSYHLANLGWSAEQILSFYYPGTKIQPLSESIVFWRERE